MRLKLAGLWGLLLAVVIATAMPSALPVSAAPAARPVLDSGSCLNQGAFYICSTPLSKDFSISSAATVTVKWENASSGTQTLTVSGVASGSVTCTAPDACVESGHVAAGTLTASVSTCSGICVGAAAQGFLYLNVVADPAPTATPDHTGQIDCGIAPIVLLNCNMIGGTYGFPGAIPSHWFDAGNGGWVQQLNYDWLGWIPSGTIYHAYQKGVGQVFTIPSPGQVCEAGEWQGAGFHKLLTDPGGSDVAWGGTAVVPPTPQVLGSDSVLHNLDYHCTSALTAGTYEYYTGDGGEDSFFLSQVYFVPDSSVSGSTATAVAQATATQGAIDQATVVAQATATQATSDGATATSVSVATQTAVAALTATQATSDGATATAQAAATQTAVAGGSATSVAMATVTAQAAATQTAVAGGAASPTVYVPPTPGPGGTPVDGATLQACTNILCTCLQTAAGLIAFSVGGVTGAISGTTNAVNIGAGSIATAVTGGSDAIATAISGVSVHGSSVFTVATDLVGPVATLTSAVSASAASAALGVSTSISNTGNIVAASVFSSTASLVDPLATVAASTSSIATSAYSSVVALGGIGTSIDTAALSGTSYLSHLSHLDDINNDLQGCPIPTFGISWIPTCHIGLADAVIALDALVGTGLALLTTDSVAAGAVLGGDSVALATEGGILAADETVVMADTTAMVTSAEGAGVALGGFDFFSRVGQLLNALYQYWQSNQAGQSISTGLTDLGGLQSDAYTSTVVLQSLPLSLTVAMSDTAVRLFVPHTVSADLAPLVAAGGADVPALPLSTAFDTNQSCVDPVLVGVTIGICPILSSVSVPFRGALAFLFGIGFLAVLGRRWGGWFTKESV